MRTNRMVLYQPFPRQKRQGKPTYHEENHACLEENTSWRRILRSEQRARSCVGYKEPSRWSWWPRWRIQRKNFWKVLLQAVSSKAHLQYLSHLNPKSSYLFQRPRSPCKSFNPAKDEVWFCSVPLGHNSLENMLRAMTSRAGMQPYLTNHSIRATTVSVLPAANYESRYIKAITGHQSRASIESYSNTPTFHQFKAMSNAIADFVDSGCSSVDPSASLVAESTGMKAASSSIHSTSSSPDESNDRKSVEIHLVHGLIPGGTFHGCTFNFTVNLPGSSSQQNI